MIDLKSVRASFEKTAWIWPAVNVAFTAAGIAGDYKSNKSMAKFSPLDQDNRYSLQSPYAYQFDGGKHLSTKPTIGIN